MVIEAHRELPLDLGPWVIVANIVEYERGGPDPEKVYRGTKIYAPGTKVYIGSRDGGRFENFGVLGLNRVSKKLTVSMVNISVLDNLRSKVIYNEKILQKLLWSQFMPVFQGERPNKRNMHAGSACLFKDKEASDRLVAGIRSATERIALRKLQN